MNELQNFKLIDSHCHLDYEQLYDDLDDIIYRANQNKVTEFITIGTTLTGINKIKAISKKYKFIWHTAGIHPHKAGIDEFSTDFEKIKKYCLDKKCVGVGEAGLDYYYDFSPKKDQLNCFETQINVSQTINKPIVIHSRDADKDMEEILTSNYNENSFNGVLHCFTGSKKLAKAALDLGFYISFSGIVTFKNSKEIQDIASYIPADRYLIETDAPFLSPVPFRGKINEPKNTYYVAEFISKLRNISLDMVANQTRDNTLSLFDNMRTN